jgi:glutamate synthase (NADPH/NADH) small chain
MPARKEEIHHAEEEGIEFLLLTNPVKFKGNEKGRVTSMTCLKMELGEPDEGGRRRPVEVKGSEFEIETDLSIIAVGAGANPLLTQSDKEIKLNQWGYIMADSETGKTFKKGVWAGGDIVSGQATVILAMGAGRQVAKSIDDYLTRGW